MNDFTKDELEELHGGIGWMYSEQTGCVDDDIENNWLLLRDKIQSLIDNYCDHENLDAYDLFLPKVGAILTDEKKSGPDKLQLIKNLYLRTVWPEKVENQNDN